MIATLLSGEYLSPGTEYNPECFFKKMRREILYQSYIKISLQFTLTIAEKASNEGTGDTATSQHVIGENNVCNLPTKCSPVPKRRLLNDT
jgi:hypothetical protein